MSEGPEAGREAFRDSLAIVSREGKRKWVYPKRIIGRFYRYRTVLSVLLLAVLFGTPFLRVNGNPFMLFNVIERKFILFGQVFGPHDFTLFALVLITGVVFIILFTVILGRLFCGWVCPQTVFMEMVFRKIDYWVEGDHRAQRRLDESPWGAAKFLRKGVKYAVYFALSFLIANTLLAYIIGTDHLFRIVTDPPSEHLGGLIAALSFSALFYWIFIWFREQACILVCPYGRLQGVLLDRNSIVIAYDHVRGEPRGRIRRGKERTEGDCVDCDQCVEVCPTGIDIRNGTQLECINCTACIDACDMVMDKIKRLRGLIRYDSAENIVSRRGFRWTPRVTGYSFVLLALTGLLAYLLSGRTDLDVTLLRSPGMFYQEQPGDRVSNIYDVKVLNKSFAPAPVEFRLLEPEGELQLLGDALVVPPQESADAKLMVVLGRGSLTSLSTPVLVGAYRDGKEIARIGSTFLGPGTQE